MTQDSSLGGLSFPAGPKLALNTQDAQMDLKPVVRKAVVASLRALLSPFCDHQPCHAVQRFVPLFTPACPLFTLACPFPHFQDNLDDLDMMCSGQFDIPLGHAAPAAGKATASSSADLANADSSTLATAATASASAAKEDTAADEDTAGAVATAATDDVAAPNLDDASKHSCALHSAVDLTETLATQDDSLPEDAPSRDAAPSL